MAYFSLPLKMAATVYIQATLASEAQSKLDQVLCRTIDARDKRWFSAAPYGVLFFPEFSFATAMMLFKPDVGSDLSEISLPEVYRLMSSNDESKKSTVLPHSTDWFGEGKLPIYTVDLNVEATGIIKMGSLTEASELVSRLTDLEVHWEVAEHWFEIEGLVPFPLILSPTLKVVSVAEDCELTRRWPERDVDYRVAAAINAEIEQLAGGFRALEIDALSRKLKSYFDSRMSFLLLTNDDVHQIAGGLIDRVMRKEAGTRQ